MTTTWKQLCRACLISKETFSYILSENVSTEIYLFCTSIEVIKDGLPQTLCNSCHELLMKYSEFKRTCIQSQNTLHNMKFIVDDVDDNFNTEPDIFVEPLKISNEIKVKSEDRSEVKTEDTSDQCNDGDVDDNFNTEPDIFVKHLESSNEIKVKSEYLTKVKTEDTSDRCNNDSYSGVNLCEDSVLLIPRKLTKRRKKKIGKQQSQKVSKAKINVKRKHFTFTCDICNKKFNYLERFQAHKLEHEGKVPKIHCMPCNKTYMTWSGLRRHNDSEHTLVSLETLECSICGKICKSQQTLKMHKQTHGNRKLYVCDVCGKGCTTKFTLKSHLETHKETRERLFTCEHCGKKFYTNAILLTHVLRQHTGRRFICQICKYPFTDKCNLAKHMQKHDGKKLYKCEICSKSYGTQSSLVEHRRIHSGERPYNCNYCPKCFLSKRRLDDHHRVHTGERPHKCSVCEQGFTQRGTLKRHMKVHDRTMPVVT